MKKNIVITILTLLLVIALTVIVVLWVYIMDLKENRTSQASSEQMICLGLVE